LKGDEQGKKARIRELASHLFGNFGPCEFVSPNIRLYCRHGWRTVLDHAFAAGGQDSRNLQIVPSRPSLAGRKVVLEMSFKKKPPHLHEFSHRGIWDCQFLEADLKTHLPWQLTVRDPAKIGAMAERVGAFEPSKTVKRSITPLKRVAGEFGFNSTRSSIRS
jgi:hypothetical protein